MSGLVLWTTVVRLFEHLYDRAMTSAAHAVDRDTRQRELWARTAQVAGRLNRAHADLVDIAAELIDDGHWGDGGFSSPQHYLVVRAGLSPAHAADVVRVASRRTELPAAAEALGAGELSLDQVSVVARHVPGDHQGALTALARHATVPQLRRVVTRHAFAAAVAPADDGQGLAREGEGAFTSASEQRACARPELSMRYDEDGRFQLRYSAPATVGALVEQAVREAKDALFLRRSAATDEPTAGAEEDLGRPTYGDALEEMAHRSLGAVRSTSRASHYRVHLHLSTDGAWVNGGHAIPLRLLGRFVSDGVVQPVWETEGRPVSVGRAMRILPERTRRLIEDRDRGCRFPGCTVTRFVEIHHLRAWSDGGRTDDDNQVSLCPQHHDALDRGDYTLTGDPTRPDGLVARNRYGWAIGPPDRRETAEPPGGDPPVPPGTYRPPTGEHLVTTAVELPPDAWRAPPRLAAVPDLPAFCDEREDDDLVFDSYRRR
jgi:hypothetical protein